MLISECVKASIVVPVPKKSRFPHNSSIVVSYYTNIFIHLYKNVKMRMSGCGQLTELNFNIDSFKKFSQLGLNTPQSDSSTRH